MNKLNRILYFTIFVIKRISSLLILLSYINCFAQQKLPSEDYFYGKWKCIKHDYRGYQSFTLEQAEKIRLSIFNIEKNKIYYSNLDFIELCSFSKFKISKYDTTIFYGMLEYTYTKKELSKLFYIEPIDDKGNDTCFNGCAILFLKQDTLINLCGGYTYYLIKETK